MRKPWFLLLAVLATIAPILIVQSFQRAADAESPAATYANRTLHLTLAYDAPHHGSGRLTIEVLDPEDAIVGSFQRRAGVSSGKGRWQEDLTLSKALPIDDLVWHRLRYRFAYDGEAAAAIEGAESISQILRRPVIHIVGQQS